MNEREEDERTEQIPRESAPERERDDSREEEWGILAPFIWFFGVI